MWGQPWRASQTPLRPSWRPGGPLKWVLALKSYLCPSQAIRETWRVLELGVSPGELHRPLSGHQREPEGPRGGVSPLELPRPLSGHHGDLVGLGP